MQWSGTHSLLPDDRNAVDVVDAVVSRTPACGSAKKCPPPCGVMLPAIAASSTGQTTKPSRFIQLQALRVRRPRIVFGRRHWSDISLKSPLTHSVKADAVASKRRPVTSEGFEMTDPWAQKKKEVTNKPKAGGSLP